ncbi:SLC13 family permease [Herbaspirillum seropedicae]|uniref:SLC13 family permease n=1 Tax=Herbaspirillum seropedicae TaxID=964 RepID=UPI00285907CB|nr:SLC13 family permease [Herbaspirillum seropedicae]MDR6397515.1 Mg2+/citrate symporter [Herbaspirillum seropedicae]
MILTLLFFPRIPSVVVFMVGLAASLLVNYRTAAAQMVMVKRHSAEALLLSTVLLCAGVFLGVLTKSGMLDHLSNQLIAVLPASAARYDEGLIRVNAIFFKRVLFAYLRWRKTPLASAICGGNCRRHANGHNSPDVVGYVCGICILT